MARESTLQVAVLCNLIVSTIWITSKAGTTAAIKRPFHLAIGTLLICAIACFLLNWRTGRRSRKREQKASDIPLSQKNDLDVYSRIEEEGQSATRTRKWLRIAVGSIGSMVMHIAIRVIIVRWIRESVQCSWDGIELFLPLCLLNLEIFHRKGQTAGVTSKTLETSSSRSLLLVSAWAFSTFTITQLSASRSTYICPNGGQWRYFVRFIQCLGMALDAGMIHEFSNIAQGLGKATGRPWEVFGKIAILSTAVLGMLASAFLLKNPEHTSWSFDLDQQTRNQLIVGSLLCGNWIVSVLYLLHEVRPVTIVLILSCISLCTFQISVWPYQFSELVGYRSTLLGAICLAGFISMAGILRAERDASRLQRPLALQRDSIRILAVLLSLMGAALLGSAILLHSRPNTREMHPINLLMRQAKAHSRTWETQAASSKTLSEAVANYQTRYGIPPPPNFDKWYAFAIARNSTIIDNFDQIYNDLLPFWGMEPTDIRARTGHMLTHSWVEVAGVRISNGAASIGPHMPPTHRWMVEGAVDMINKFVEHLPDMDLAFNIHDENRVAVPWAEMEMLKAKAMVARLELNKTKVKLRPSFFPHIVDVWDASFMQPEAPNNFNVTSPFFKNAAFKPSFEHYGIISCSPHSFARRHQWSNPKRICRQCLAPHTLSTFVSNWTLSGSLCHQPDLANLHGFHMSPSTLKVTNHLYPIFSQSKVPTFSDIVFPSPWNYRDKVTYVEKEDIPFAEKLDSVFWRGATSEGLALEGSWMGMQRQRFVHLLSKTLNSTPIKLLLPSSSSSPNFQNVLHTPRILPLTSIRALTTLNVSFVDAPSRCDTPNSRAQTNEFAFSPSSVPFATHWRYKYLFDLDGAGFSGRFLPFVQSHSLVFRAATFRQWFDERLVAWVHFVPVDARLEEVWGLLGFFGGVLGRGGSGEGEKAHAHVAEAEQIAEEGREWASRVLRKEDMEVYMFRLLLEWGRVVDDRRVQLGFTLDGT